MSPKSSAVWVTSPLMPSGTRVSLCSRLGFISADIVPEEPAREQSVGSALQQQCGRGCLWLCCLCFEGGLTPELPPHLLNLWQSRAAELRRVQPTYQAIPKPELVAPDNAVPKSTAAGIESSPELPMADQNKSAAGQEMQNPLQSAEPAACDVLFPSWSAETCCRHLRNRQGPALVSWPRGRGPAPGRRISHAAVLRSARAC